VLGAGFAGLWSAVAAARRLDELGVDAGQVEILAVNRTAWHSIRVRNYEADLDLDPIGIKHIVADVAGVNIPERKVQCTNNGVPRSFSYDRLVFALGSRLALPEIPGVETYGFDPHSRDERRELPARHQQEGTAAIGFDYRQINRYQSTKRNRGFKVLFS
jgi:NADH:ubiquinone reductase (H+-translocating)